MSCIKLEVVEVALDLLLEAWLVESITITSEGFSMDPTLLFFRPNVFEVEDEPFVRFEGPSILTQVSKPTANQQLCSQAGTYIKCNLSRVVNNPGSAPPKRISCSKIKTTFLIDEAFAGLSSSLREFIHFCYRQITHFSQCFSIITSVKFTWFSRIRGVANQRLGTRLREDYWDSKDFYVWWLVRILV